MRYLGQRLHDMYYWFYGSVISFYVKELIWVSTGGLEQSLPLTLGDNCNEISTHELKVWVGR